MPAPADRRPEKLQAVLSSARVGLSPFVRALGLGVGAIGNARLFRCHFPGDGTVLVAPLDGETKAELDVLVVMEQSAWQTLAACEQKDAPRIIYELTPNITGHLPTFIRHLHAVVNVVKLAAPVLAE